MVGSKIAFFLVFIVLCSFPAFGQASHDPCNTGNLPKGKFHTYYLGGTDQHIWAQVIVEAKLQTDENFQNIAAYFKAKYCRADRIYVGVYDSRDHIALMAGKTQPTKAAEYPRAAFVFDRADPSGEISVCKVVGDDLSCRDIALKPPKPDR